MKLLLTIALTFLFSNIFGQIDHYYIGLDFGLNKEFNQIISNDDNYFSCWSRCWGEKDDFLDRNGNFSLTAGVELKNSTIYELMITRQTLNFRSQYSLDRFLIFDGVTGAGISSMSQHFKYSGGVGKRIYLGKQFSYIPMIQISYMFVENNTDTTFVESTSRPSHSYYESLRNINEHNLFLGLKNTFQWQASNRWRLNLNIGYNQGLLKNYELKQEVQLTESPENVYKGNMVSRLSHAYVSLGTSYVIKKK